MNIRTLLIAAMTVVFAQSAVALDKKKFCIWDPVGNNGPAVTFFKPMVTAAIGWGIEMEIVAYTDEKVASNDFKAGVCDAVFLTAILSRQYVPFAGTLDSMGGILNEDGLNRVIKTVASNKKVAELMTNGKYEVVGTLPVGSVFLFVNDRNIDTVPEFSGKKISVLNEDPQALKFASLAGASPVGTSLATFAGQFNNGNIDLLPMVALGYNVFELYHGLGDKGGIIDHKLFYGMMQLVTHNERFADGFGDQSRNYILTRLKDIHKMVDDAEKEIPGKYWIKTDEATRKELDNFAREVRLGLKEDGVNHPVALKVLQKLRCFGEDKARAECSTPE